MRIVGLIPAAGRAKRLAPLPCSKELLPIGYHTIKLDGELVSRPRVVSQYLLDAMIEAGVQQAMMVLNKDKWDIVQYYGNGRDYGVQLAYTVQDDPRGMPVSLDAAHAWVEDATVLFGMPDTLFTPSNMFVHLLKAHNSSMADVTLGLFPADDPSKFGMVDVAECGCVRRCIDKPEQTLLTHMWGCACWSPRFTAFLHQTVRDLAPQGPEVVLGDVFSAAIDQGFHVRGLTLPDAHYVDIGTIEDLRRVVHLQSK